MEAKDSDDALMDDFLEGIFKSKRCAIVLTWDPSCESPKLEMDCSKTVNPYEPLTLLLQMAHGLSLKSRFNALLDVMAEGDPETETS